MGCGCHSSWAQQFGTDSEPARFQSLAEQRGAATWSPFRLSPAKAAGDLEAHLNRILITQELSKAHDFFFFLITQELSKALYINLFY